MYREIERDSKRPLSLTRCRTLNRVDTLTRLECHQSVADAKLEIDDVAGNGDAERGVLIVEENGSSRSSHRMERVAATTV